MTDLLITFADNSDIVATGIAVGAGALLAFVVVKVLFFIGTVVIGLLVVGAILSALCGGK